jgi:phosphoglycerate dehydrogenase-like enzyme
MTILLMYSTHAATAGHLQRLGSLGPHLRVEVADSESDAAAKVAQADIVLGHRYLRQSLPHATRLRWVQSTAGGVDRLPLHELRSMSVRLTRCSIASPMIARHAVTLAWSLNRAIPQALDHQRQGRWSQDLRLAPLPRTTMVLGLGSIGRAVARLLKADGMQVIGVKQSTAGGTMGDCDRLIVADQWRRWLPSTDWLIAALPLTKATRGMIDESALRDLPSHAIVVNVGHGATLDTESLSRVLQTGHLQGAALDVIQPKPQSAQDPLWQTPRLLITPHVASHQPERGALIESYCERQVDRFLRGQPLEDEVDLTLACERLGCLG